MSNQPTASAAEDLSISEHNVLQSVRDNKDTRQHVLIAVDASAQSEYMIKWLSAQYLDPKRHIAFLLCVARMDAQASVVYTAGAGIPWTMLEELEKESMNEAKKIVLAHHRVLKANFEGKLEIHSLIGQGDARDEIIDAVERLKSDILVVGSRGLGALKRTFLGSTSDYCVHHASCPVLIVKNPDNPKK